MSSSRNLRTSLRNRLDPYQLKPRFWVGAIGHSDGSLYPDASNRKFIWVTNFNGIPHIVFNDRAPVEAGYLVQVGINPQRPSLEEVIGSIPLWNAPPVRPSVGAHGETHEFPNHDTAFIRGEQFQPWMAVPSNMTVVIYPAATATASGWECGNPEPIDMSSYVPDHGAVVALISVDEDGEYVVTVGEIGMPETISIADVPATPAGTQALWAVKLVDSMTTLEGYEGTRYKYLFDLRWGLGGGSGGAGLDGAIAFGGILTPPAVTGDVDDYNPDDLASASVVRITEEGDYNVTGIQGGAPGRILILENAGEWNLGLLNQSEDSTAANRFMLVRDVLLVPGASIALQYDAILERWYALTDILFVDTDTTLSANSTARVPSQSAVKAYVDANAGGDAADEITADTTDFDGVLSAADTEVQAALETIDEHHPGGFVREVLGAARTYYVRHNVGDCTISIASPAVVTKAGHGLENDDPVVFKTSGALPTGLTVGTVYYVVNKATDTFEVSATVGGASINTSGTQSGTHSVATGNNSNDGKSTGRAGALLTIQKGIDLAAAIDGGIYSIAIQLASSRYLENPLLKDMMGSGSIGITGDAATPSNVIIDGGINKSTTGSLYTVNGVTVIKASGSSSVAFTSKFGAVITILNIVFSTGFAYHMAASEGGSIRIAGSYTIAGNCNYHMQAFSFGRITLVAASSVTLTGTPAWGFAMASAPVTGQIDINSTVCTYSGAATGKRYEAALNSVINTYGGGANYFPGNVAGTTATGGQYA